ncbi:MAG: hypothetical protein ACKOXK_10420 [Chakrabartia sp.]
MKHQIRIISLATAICIAPSAFAQAKIDFAAYEGPPKIVEGEGGTKITKNGIDYWTTGTPPRRYQVIGFVQDKRDESWDGGQAIGSPNIAGKVKKAGGDAVIVESQEEAGKLGGGGAANQFFGFFATGGSKTITRMLVVKYLPETPPSSSFEAPEPAK